ncbi:MAG: hypothetical protein LBV67_08660 [Streptococcaceae bacterium]|jgi:hypothetical protein|nr:hypothetical protein [Streptococcaceae bacterium]
MSDKKNFRTAFTLEKNEEDIYDFIQDNGGVQKTAEYVLFFRYLIERFNIKIEVPKEKQETLMNAVSSGSFTRFIENTKSPFQVVISKKLGIIFEYLVQRNDSTPLSAFLKESYKLFLYGELVENKNITLEELRKIIAFKEENLSKADAELDKLSSEKKDTPTNKTQVSPLGTRGKIR